MEVYYIAFMKVKGLHRAILSGTAYSRTPLRTSSARTSDAAICLGVTPPFAASAAAPANAVSEMPFRKFLLL